MSKEYTMGELVGEIILLKYLPTLETDLIQTNKRVKITDPNDLKENQRLDEIMDSKMGYAYMEKEYSEAHGLWLAHTKFLAKKYLPEKLECRVTQFEIDDIESFKEGINDYLWNCDVSWYVAEDDFLDRNSDDELSAIDEFDNENELREYLQQFFERT